MRCVATSKDQRNRWLEKYQIPWIPFLQSVCLMTALCWQTGFAAEENLLEAMDIGTLPGNKVQIRFQLAQPLPAPPRSFTINEPARVVLDFPATRSGLSNRQQTINKGVAEQVNVLEGSDRTRATVNLARLVPYSLRSEGNIVLLTLDAGTAKITAATPAVERLAATTGTLNRIDFRRGTQGEGVISIKLSNPSLTANVREEGNQIIADFLGANLPRGQERRLDVTDFATPVTQVDAVNQGNNARIAVRPTTPYEYLAYQVDDVYTIEVRRPPEEKKEELDPRKKVFTGELLSLNFQDIEVRAVLQILADFTGQNIVVSDTVQGNLTLRLQNVPWDQALDIILRTKGLTMRQNGNVIYIAPTEEVAAREKLELEARKTVTELVPLRSELIQVNYAKAKTLADLLKTKGTQKEASLLSPRGQVNFDERTNTLLVQDIPDKLTEIRSLITRLDVPVRQVMIDSRLVIANDNFSKELGVRFGGAYLHRSGSKILSVSGSAEGNNTVITGSPTGGTTGTASDEGVIGNLIRSGQPYPAPVPSLADRLGVSLPVANPTGQIALAILGRDFLVDLELSAMQAEGRGETLSNPRVLTADRAKAVIKQGREIPYQTAGSQGEPTTLFKEAVLELTVTPQITPDGRIIMDLIVTKNEQGRFVVQGIQGSQLPTIDKREVQTQVLVNNGETVVLGGVFEQISADNVDKVPLLGDIPAIGRLFRKNTNRNDKLELLVFVTPQIVSESSLISR